MIRTKAINVKRFYCAASAASTWDWRRSAASAVVTSKAARITGGEVEIEIEMLVALAQHIMNFSSLVAPRVAEERKRLGMSQEAAGNACGVSREMWGKYERGKAVMGTEVLALFAAAGADVLYILTGAREAPPAEVLSADERELLALFRQAPLTGKMAAVGALQGVLGQQTTITASGQRAQASGRDIINKGGKT